MPHKMQSQDLIVKQSKFEYFRCRGTKKRPHRINKTISFMYFGITLLKEGIPCDLGLLQKRKDPIILPNSCSEMLLCTSSGYSSMKISGSCKRHTYFYSRWCTIGIPLYMLFCNLHFLCNNTLIFISHK